MNIAGPSALVNVWVETLADGLVRADQIIGIETHRTPAIGDKPSRWLLDVIVSAVSGAGSTTERMGDWTVTPLHRTLAQSAEEARDAPVDLARLLSQLASTTAAGIVTAHTPPTGAPADPATSGRGKVRHTASHDEAARPTAIRFRFVPFTSVDAERRGEVEHR